MLALRRQPPQIHGQTAPGFERVAEVFRENFKKRGEVGASVFAYVRGEPVVDLWAGYADQASQRPWERDTLVVTFSTTKGLVASCLLALSDRGALDVDRPVAEYWPAFAQAGKAAITVRQLLNHRSGLATIERPLTLDDFEAPERVSAALEAQEPLWTPNSTQGYHAISWGPYAGELFRHVAGERLGSFMRREIGEPFGADVYLGLPPDLDERVATLYPVRKRDALVHILPRMVGSRSVDGRVFRSVLIRPKTRAGRAFRSNPSMGPKLLGAMNEPRLRRLELPWANLHASAKGLARAYAPLAHGGEWEGRRLVRAETIEQVTPRQTWSERDEVLQKPIGFSQGFCKDELHLISPNPRAFGHTGMGGSTAFADPDAQLSFGYVMNRMDFRVRSPRCIALCNAIYACLANR